MTLAKRSDIFMNLCLKENKNKKIEKRKWVQKRRKQEERWGKIQYSDISWTVGISNRGEK